MPNNSTRTSQLHPNHLRHISKIPENLIASPVKQKYVYFGPYDYDASGEKFGLRYEIKDFGSQSSLLSNRKTNDDHMGTQVIHSSEKDVDSLFSLRPPLGSIVYKYSKCIK